LLSVSSTSHSIVFMTLISMLAPGIVDIIVVGADSDEG
jgi:hypothetical protein